MILVIRAIMAQGFVPLPEQSDEEAETPIDETEISLTFAKGLAVLRAFEGVRDDLSMADLARRLGFTRAATRRLVRTLEMLGYVATDRQRYRLTARALRLSTGFLQSRSVGHLIAPVLQAESALADEPISLACLDGEEAVYAVHVPIDTRAGTAGYTVGSSLPLVSTAIGHAILAHIPVDQRNRMTAISALGDAARTQLETDLAAVRELGFAQRPIAGSDGLVALAVPAFTTAEVIAGALSIVLTPDRVNPERITRVLLPVLQRCARYIATAL
jgi:IclR family transcriptional regulator, pca regulon regulatory protein